MTTDGYCDACTAQYRHGGCAQHRNQPDPRTAAEIERDRAVLNGHAYYPPKDAVGGYMELVSLDENGDPILPPEHEATYSFDEDWYLHVYTCKCRHETYDRLNAVAADLMDKHIDRPHTIAALSAVTTDI